MLDELAEAYEMEMPYEKWGEKLVLIVVNSLATYTELGNQEYEYYNCTTLDENIPLDALSGVHIHVLDKLLPTRGIALEHYTKELEQTLRQAAEDYGMHTFIDADDALIFSEFKEPTYEDALWGYMKYPGKDYYFLIDVGMPDDNNALLLNAYWNGFLEASGLI